MNKMNNRMGNFTHNGFDVTIKDDSEKSIAEWKSDFDEWEKNCLEFTGKRIIFLDNARHLQVDWKAYFQFKHQQRHSDRILIDIGIFSYDPVKNWQIVGGSLNLNRLNPAGRILYFTREEDVVGYARLEYGGAMYCWLCNGSPALSAVIKASYGIEARKIIPSLFLSYQP